MQADEGPQLYWQFLDSLDLSDAAAAAGNGSSSMCWHSIVDQASALCLPQVAKVRIAHPNDAASASNTAVSVGVWPSSWQASHPPTTILFLRLSPHSLPADPAHCCGGAAVLSTPGDVQAAGEAA